MFFVIEVVATPQISDKLIYKGDTLNVYFNLSEEFYKIDTVINDTPIYNYSVLNVNLFGKKISCGTTACWRGYRSIWEIIDNQIYLIGIYSCCYYDDSIKADLNYLFKDKCINGKVKATWINGNFICGKGERLIYDHDMYSGGVYEYDMEINLEKGKLIDTKLYNNTKSKQSDYPQNSIKMLNHIYSNINWDILPQEDTTIRIFLEFSGNEYGIIDEVKILKGFNETYNQEAIRVIKTIPEWDIYYIKGEFKRKVWMMPIIFSKENRNKYKK
ncbi:MAG: hypothetical protein H6Q16_1074 [Bacteroidetes bacterium]|nr:hypothetical protein [Bacteroidota bacterium]